MSVNISISFLVLTWMFIGCSPGYRQQVEHMKAEIEMSGGVEHLREWALPLMDKYRSSPNANIVQEVSKSEAPDWLSHLGSPFPFLGVSYFRATNDQHEYLSVVWASGRGGVGVRIGSRNYIASEFPTELYWIEASPGIYIFAQRRN